jgi:hypothetical protein
MDGNIRLKFRIGESVKSEMFAQALITAKSSSSKLAI